MKQVPVILLGAGGVGRALMAQLSESHEQIAARHRCHFNVAAVADSGSWRWDPGGLGRAGLQEVVAFKKQNKALGDPRPATPDVVETAVAAGLEKVIVVDLTAADGMEATLERALAHGYGVVLANKKPLAGPWQTAQVYYGQPLVRYEATVGGGQPVIATLRYLLDTNDPPHRIEGQLSGTLSYICRRMEEGTRFSVALAAAKAKGYTEPDPRADLSGRDVMRKVMILGRTAGLPLEESDVAVESLYPSALAHLDPLEFMVASVALDAPLRERVDAAGAAGETLRYIGVLENGRGTVGLEPVPMGSARSAMKYVSFSTERYDEAPLLIAGRGKGVELTAAAVLGDMIGLVREM